MSWNWASLARNKNKMLEMARDKQAALLAIGGEGSGFIFVHQIMHPNFSVLTTLAQLNVRL